MHSTKNFNYSYWETSSYFKCFDLIVIGAGIVGLNSAIAFKKKNRKAKILVLESGLFPNGASTKNAGFACFGSAGELLADLNTIPAKSVWETVKMRWDGLQLLKKRIPLNEMDYKPYGGYEVYDEQNAYHKSVDQIPHLNAQIKDLVGLNNCYTVSGSKQLNFKNMKGLILNKYEGQLNTGLMMLRLLQIAQQSNILVLNSIHVTHINDLLSRVELKSNAGIFQAKKVVVATNGFASQLLKLNDVNPARAQVLITKPILNLKLKGAFHYCEGYYYFRNIDNRILLGGGRNLDPLTETTMLPDLNPTIQNKLDQLLKTVILPDTKFEIDFRWTGIMGVGKEKKPIIKAVSKNVLAAVRMGGMGLAIGTWVGEQVANELS